MNWDTVIAAVVSFFGGGGLVAVLKHLAERDARHDKSEADARAESHKRMLDMVDKMKARIQHLEKAHDDCHRENASLREEVGRLREAVARLQAEADARRKAA